LKNRGKKARPVFRALCGGRESRIPQVARFPLKACYDLDPRKKKESRRLTEQTGRDVPIAKSKINRRP
jgi:hypothetical protein